METQLWTIGLWSCYQMIKATNCVKQTFTVFAFCLFCLFRYSQKGFHCVHSELTAAHAHNMSTLACDQEQLCEPRGNKSFI